MYFRTVHRGRIESADGIWLFGNGWPVSGSLTVDAAEIAGALLAVGTVAVFVEPHVGQPGVLPADEEERVVLLNRPAQEAAVLLAFEEVLFRREEIPRVERAIAQVIERAAMDVVGPRAGDGVDHGAGAVACAAL
jgi:hypothetical protein